jgi:hypothetical protein
VVERGGSGTVSTMGGGWDLRGGAEVGEEENVWWSLEDDGAKADTWEDGAKKRVFPLSTLICTCMRWLVVGAALPASFSRPLHTRHEAVPSGKVGCLVTTVL